MKIELSNAKVNTYIQEWTKNHKEILKEKLEERDSELHNHVGHNVSLDFDNDGYNDESFIIEINNINSKTEIENAIKDFLKNKLEIQTDAIQFTKEGKIIFYEFSEFDDEFNSEFDDFDILWFYEYKFNIRIIVDEDFIKNLEG